LKDKRALTRSFASADAAMIGAVFRKDIIGPGLISWRIVDDEEKQLVFECEAESGGSDDEFFH
jgi:hypothetical protein